jgi:hypothetical protein
MDDTDRIRDLIAASASRRQKAPDRPRMKNVELVRNEHNEITRVVEKTTRAWDVVRDDARRFSGLREAEED